MAIAKMNFEGTAQLTISEILCICGRCGQRDTENARIEFNFRDQKVIYYCSKCKKSNEMQFGKIMPQPYPKTRLG